MIVYALQLLERLDDFLLLSLPGENTAEVQVVLLSGVIHELSVITVVFLMTQDKNVLMIQAPNQQKNVL